MKSAIKYSTGLDKTSDGPASADAKRVAVGKAIEAADEGRTVPHEKVKEWLKSWGEDDELSPPE